MISAGRLAGFLIGVAVLLFTGCGESRSLRTTTETAGDQPGQGTPVAGSAAPSSGRDESAYLHPSFSLSPTQFVELARGLPEEYRDEVLARPGEFLGLLAGIAAEPGELTLLVDKVNPLPESYAPDDLVSLDEFDDILDLDRRGHRLRAVALDGLRPMVAAAREDGVALLISSAYRSFEYQAQVYQYWVNELGQEEADRTSARPGTSQHQLGTVIDFGCICEEFANTKAGLWLAENAWRHGFSLSYPQGFESVTGYTFESWHYRFVGVSAARMEREFFGGVQQHMVEFLSRKSPAFMSYFIEI